MEIPKYMKLDFMCVLLGVIIQGVTLYIIIFNIVKPELTAHYFMVSALYLMGSLLFSFGFYHMLNNYNRDNEITNLRAEIDRINLSRILQKLKKNKKLKKKKKA